MGLRSGYWGRVFEKSLPNNRKGFRILSVLFWEGAGKGCRPEMGVGCSEREPR